MLCGASRSRPSTGRYHEVSVRVLYISAGPAPSSFRPARNGGSDPETYLFFGIDCRPQHEPENAPPRGRRDVAGARRGRRGIGLLLRVGLRLRGRLRALRGLRLRRWQPHRVRVRWRTTPSPSEAPANDSRFYAHPSGRNIFINSRGTTYRTMNRRALLRDAGAAATLALLGAGTASGCCCGTNCDCANMCPYCAECDDGGGGDDPVEFE